MSHNTLAAYYQLIFAMSRQHNFTVTELESLLPFERDIYVGLQKQYIEELNKETE